MDLIDALLGKPTLKQHNNVWSSLLFIISVQIKHAVESVR
jgi:hypothetical protein